jgi:hypothetical protein
MRSAFVALWLCACSTPRQAAPPPVAPASEPTTQVSDPRLHAGTTRVGAACEASGAEDCDAIDDDCDGAIDEGCGYSSGGVQVTIAWNTGADIDLYVRDPSGEAVFYNKERQRSPLGGVLDHDARGQCRVEQELRNIENAFWPAPAPPGRYVVELHYFGPCGDAAATRVTLSIAVAGRVIGQYAYDLAPEERVSALEFDVRSER